jgi:aspartate kinase
VSTGEQITIAKLAMCLMELGYSAISYTGWQIPIVTNNIYGNAIINSINVEKILESLDKGKIVVVAGFQGVDKDYNITTLGRGRFGYDSCCNSCSIKSRKM